MEASCPYVDRVTITALKKCIDCEYNEKNKMKTGLFDRNGNEIMIGDNYRNYEFLNAPYTVFWKAGCVCGGITEELAQPLTCVLDEDGELILDEDLSWLVLTKYEKLTNEQYIKLSKNFLKYSLDCVEDYYDLTNTEQEFCSKEDFFKIKTYLNK